MLHLELKEESCEKINEENLDRAVNFYFDEIRNEQSVSELSSLEKVFYYALCMAFVTFKHLLHG
jgi:cell division protein FtsL